jgi:hypothetical protein
MREMRNDYNALVRKTEGKRLLERPRSSWEDNIKIDLRRTGFDADGIHLAQDTSRWRFL